MSVVSYKGYQGSVTFEDGRLYIQVLHVDDLLTTECVSAEDVQREFEELVDDYLETCAELGREPKKPFKGTFNVRMTPQLHKQAAMAAAKAQLSLNAWVVECVEERLRRGLPRSGEPLQAAVDLAYRWRQIVHTSPFRPIQDPEGHFKVIGSYVGRPASKHPPMIQAWTVRGLSRSRTN